VFPPTSTARDDRPIYPFPSQLSQHESSVLPDNQAISPFQAEDFPQSDQYAVMPRYPSHSIQNLDSPQNFGHYTTCKYPLSNHSRGTSPLAIQGNTTFTDHPSPLFRHSGPENRAPPDPGLETRRDTITQASHDLMARSISGPSSYPPQGSSSRHHFVPNERYMPPSTMNPYYGSFQLPAQDKRQSIAYAPYHRRDTVRPTSIAYSAAATFRHSGSSEGVLAPDYASPASPGNRGVTQELKAGTSAVPSSHPAVPSHPIPSSLMHNSSVWSHEYSGVSAAATPASTEGSADPAQSDHDESDAYSASTSTSTSFSTSENAGGAAVGYHSHTPSRWARFRVPENIFRDPQDPVRHHLYHQIRQESWFIHQNQERPITVAEAAQIEGAMPGESILLAFYDRITDSQNRTVMRCTICARTNPHAQLYPRPDRAKIHMRHHFELRPIECRGQCRTAHCSQRFFTSSDLTAHVTGKTEPLSPCPNCQKMMRQKNLKRHMTQFCAKLKR
ncbi:hypothetical protein FRC19_003201, partial [Serendipita sp. 401]